MEEPTALLSWFSQELICESAIQKMAVKGPVLWCNHIGANQFTTRVTPNTAQESQT